MTDPGFRRLVVMRHAKAEKSAAKDHARRLTDRGVNDAVASGRWLAENDLVPDFVLVSSAARARSTFDCVSVGLGSTPDVRVMDELYQADADDVIDVCSMIPDAADCAMVIGHNPTMDELAHTLQSEPLEDSPTSLSTSGLAVFDCATDWDSFAARTCALDRMYSPRR